MKITEYPKTDKVSKDDVLIVDGTSGTRIVESEDLAIRLNESISTDPAIAHRNVFRGKNLGNKFTDEQKAHISDGSFEDLYVGDYWTINDHIWRIVDFNYYIMDNPYDTSGGMTIKENHVVVMPDSRLYVEKFVETTDQYSVGYANSYMRSTGLTQAKNIVKQAFGSDCILTGIDYLSTNISGTFPGLNNQSAYVKDMTVEIPSVTMLYGFPSMIGGSGSPAQSGINGEQFALFNLTGNKYINGDSFWFRDATYNYNTFAHLYQNSSGVVTGKTTPKTDTDGVRPYFCLKG